MNRRVEIVAEIANAHQGRPDLALALALAAHEAGADAVKFQIYTASELLVQSHPRFGHFEKQSFSAAAWADIFAALSSKQVAVYADVFGFDALEIACSNGAAALKVHSSDLGNRPLLQAVARTAGR